MKTKRLEFQKECPQCSKLMDYYDDQENKSYAGFCKDCGYEDPNDYYEQEDGHLVLLTKEEASERGLCSFCPQCGDVVYPFEKENGSDKCIICQACE